MRQDFLEIDGDGPRQRCTRPGRMNLFEPGCGIRQRAREGALPFVVGVHGGVERPQSGFPGRPKTTTIDSFAAGRPIRRNKLLQVAVTV